MSKSMKDEFGFALSDVEFILFNIWKIVISEMYNKILFG